MSSDQEVLCPLFTVTTKSNGSTNEKGRLSRAIHAASIAAGYPVDDLFQRFLSLGPSHFRVDLYYPALPKPAADNRSARRQNHRLGGHVDVRSCSDIGTAYTTRHFTSFSEAAEEAGLSRI